MGWCFTSFGINDTLLNAWDKQTIYNPTEDAFGWGLSCYLGGGGWIGPTWTIFISELVPHYPPQNNHFGSKWSHAAQQWQKCVNTTINWYSRTFFVIVWWSLTNVTAYNVRFGCNFFGTKTYGMDRVGCGEDDRGNNNIQKDKRSLLTYMRRCRSAHCNDLAVYGLHNPHVCWKNEVPWDTSK